MDHKIIGILNGIFGAVYLIFGISFSLIISKLTVLYNEANTSVSYQPLLAYGFVAGMIIFGFVNLLLAFTQFTKSKIRYRKFSIIFLVLSVLFLSFYISSLIISVILPIYKLTQSFS